MTTDSKKPALTDASEATPTAGSLPTAVLPEGFHQLDGARKVNALLSVPDPAALVAAMAPDELYFVLNDIGLSDCQELIALTTTEQRVAFVDFDSWAGDTLEAAGLDQWLETLRLNSVELAVDTAAALDPELLVDYLLCSVVEIIDRTEEDELAKWEAHYDLLQTPDGDFFLVLEGGDQEGLMRVHRLVDLLYRGGLEQARDLITSARTGLRLENEELAYRFRTGRMADLGFPPHEDAVEMFANFDLAALRAELEEQPEPDYPAEDVRTGWALARSSGGGSFLRQAAEDHPSPERFARDFAMCVNRAVVVLTGRQTMADGERLSAIARSTADTISLGLELVAEGDLDRARTLLPKAWLLQLFQAGHAAAVARARRANHLHTHGGSLFPAELARTIGALRLLPQPRVATRDGTRVFATRADLEAVDVVLDEAAALLDAFENVFGFDLGRFERAEIDGLTEADRDFITFDTLARTLVARATLDTPSLDPLDVAALTTLRAGLDRIEPAAAALAERIAPAGRPVLVRASRELREVLAALPAGSPPDARFLFGTLLTRR